MGDETIPAERCAICGTATTDGHRYCRIYRAEGPITLCSPACAEAYLHGSGRSTNGQMPFQEMADEQRWNRWAS